MATPEKKVKIEIKITSDEQTITVAVEAPESELGEMIESLTSSIGKKKK